MFNTFKITILTGLPACGKTTYVNKHFSSKDDQSCLIIHLDDYLIDGKYDYDKILTIHGFSLSNVSHIVIDGFLPTINDRKELINKLITHRLNRYKRQNIIFSLKIQEIYWNENREVSIINDSYRNRNIASTRTILCSKYERPLSSPDIEGNCVLDIEILDTIFKNTKKYSTSDIFDIAIMHNSNIKSEYDDSCILVSKWIPEDKWTGDFIELDEIFEKICPNITYLQYKRIWRESYVQLETKRIRDDYYSDVLTLYKRYTVNINTLKEILKKYILI